MWIIRYYTELYYRKFYLNSLYGIILQAGVVIIVHNAVHVLFIYIYVFICGMHLGVNMIEIGNTFKSYFL